MELDYKYNLKEYWSLLRKYKGLFFSIIFILLVIEVGFLLEKFLFKEIVDKGTLFITHSISQSDFREVLIMVGSSFLIIMMIIVIARWVRIHLLNILDAHLILDIKKKYFNHIIHLSHRFHTTHKTGSLISKLIRSGSAAERATDVIVYNFVPLLLQLLIIIPSLMTISWFSALSILLTAIFFVVFSVYILLKQIPANVAVNKAEDVEKAMVADSMTNIDSVHYYGKEEEVKSRFHTLTSDAKAKYIKAWNFYRGFDAGHIAILAIGSFFVLLVPILELLEGQVTPGDVAFVYAVFVGLKGPVFGFAHGVRGFYRSMVDFDELFKYGKVESEIKDAPDAKDLEVATGEVEFKNISFNYGKRRLFKNFSLKVKKNQKVALVGHSGSGKTTLIKLLYRFYDVDKGEILVDGVSTKSVKQQSLRNEMSIVPQECILFDDTVYNNVAFSNPEATRKEVLAAMRFAQLDRIVKQFPQKEKTIVGERGVKLSGGEKQRVSIARAILANKKILVLDEATSALDSQTEHEIQRDLEKLMKGRTTLIIAHRLSTIMKADVIVVLKEGRIVQMGSHSQLLKKKGEYKSLWDLQKGGYTVNM